MSDELHGGGGIGASLPRREDDRLTRGQGRFVGDIRLPDMLEMVVVRSPYAHARIASIDATAALAVPGVVAVFTARELARAGIAVPGLPVPLLAEDTVHYVGEAVAVVLAISRYAAEDGRDALEVQYEALQVVANIEQALAQGAVLVSPGLTSNVAVDQTASYGDVAQAFATAAVVLEEQLQVARASAHPLEPRGIVAEANPRIGEIRVWAATQVPHGLRRILQGVLGIAERQVRVIAPDVGGAFGVKANTYPEDILVPVLSWQLARPIRYLEDREEHFTATLHEREQRHRVRLAATATGELLALEDDFIMDLGAYPIWPHVMFNTVKTIVGPYHLPAFHCRWRGVVTHKTPVGPYRGAGRPQGNFVMERMMDRLARAIHQDPAEVRAKNLILPEEMPYTNGIGHIYDSGNFPLALEKALQASGYQELRHCQLKARKAGRLLGIGLSAYVEDTGGSGPFEGAALRVESDGNVTVYSGAPASGQSHETVFAQVAASALNIDVEQITVVATDTAHPVLGIGTFGSRSAVVAAGAVIEAAQQLRARVGELAAGMLEADVQDIEVSRSGAFVRGVPSRTVSWQEMGALGNSFSFGPLPPGITPGLEAVAYQRGGRAVYGSGVHVALVEVDPQTFEVRLRNYWVVHDCGTLLNPMVVTGQVQGGVAQGIGTALFEELRYDDQGQLLNQSYLDYLLPTAPEVPPIEVEHLEAPSPWSVTGAKGAGEGGTIPALAAVAGAVEDALQELGVKITELPIRPHILWQAYSREESHPV